MTRADIEKQVIGSILRYPENFARFVRTLPPEHFTPGLHQGAMRAIHTCHAAGDAINSLNVAATDGKLNVADVMELEISGGADLGLLTRRLAECAMMDRFKRFRATITDEADVFDLINGLRELDGECAATVGANMEPDKLQMLEDFVGTLQTNATRGVQRIPTGFRTLDSLLSGGLAPGNISFVGGSPGSGKTSFMLSLALNAAKSGVRVSFFEGEMTSDEILERVNGISTGESLDLIRSGREFNRISRSFVSDFFNLPFDIIVDRERTIDGLVAQIKQRALAGARLIFVDYLQVYATKGRADDEFSQIKRVSEMLRKIALQNQVHLCIASSLNRNEQGQARLSLNSLYGSSQLGHDCAVALLLTGQQVDLAELQSKERAVTLSVVKNRTGGRGDITLRFLLESQRMEEFTPHVETAAVGFRDSGDGDAY